MIAGQSLRRSPPHGGRFFSSRALDAKLAPERGGDDRLLLPELEHLDLAALDGVVNAVAGERQHPRLMQLMRGDGGPREQLADFLRCHCVISLRFAYRSAPTSRVL